MVKIFVYGTLKESGSLFYPDIVGKVLDKEDTLSDYSIYSSTRAPFPMLLEDIGGTAHGEVHEVREDYIRYFDRIENEGILYKRKKAVTNKGHEVYVYVFINKFPNLTKVRGMWNEQV